MIERGDSFTTWSYFHAFVIKESNDKTVDDKLSDNNSPGQEYENTDPNVLECSVLLELAIRVELVQLSWDFNPTPVSKRAELSDDQDRYGHDEWEAEAPHQVADFNFRSEKWARKLVVFIVAIEDNWKNKSPDQRRDDTEVTEEGLSDAFGRVGA